MTPTDLVVLGAAVAAAFWPQVRKLLPGGGKGPVGTDVDRIVAALLDALKAHGPLGPAPLVSPVKLDRAAAMAALLALEGELRTSGFDASAAQVAAAAALLLAPEPKP